MNLFGGTVKRLMEYEELEIQCKALTGMDFNDILNKFAAGYQLLPPIERSKLPKEELQRMNEKFLLKLQSDGKIPKLGIHPNDISEVGK